MIHDTWHSDPGTVQTTMYIFKITRKDNSVEYVECDFEIVWKLYLRGEIDFGIGFLSEVGYKKEQSINSKKELKNKVYASKNAMLKYLATKSYNVTQAANGLGITTPSLRGRLRRMNLLELCQERKLELSYPTNKHVSLIYLNDVYQC